MQESPSDAANPNEKKSADKDKGVAEKNIEKEKINRKKKIEKVM